MKNFKPVKGMKVFATGLHPFKQSGDLVGDVIAVDDQFVDFLSDGDTEKLIWKFKNGDLNTFHKFRF